MQATAAKILVMISLICALHGGAQEIDWSNQPKEAGVINDGIHDPASWDILQNPIDALRHLPKDRLGATDWAKAIRDGLINPRADYRGDSEMTVLNLDIILTRTKEMPHVRFPHEIHTRWLDCSNCHPAIFEARQGSNAITMDAILKGEYCGRCHGRVAFPPYICERCHNVLHEGSPVAWW